MKFSEVPLGSYILVPCPRCGEKRRRKVTRHGEYEWKKIKEALCKECHVEDVAERGDLLNTPNIRKHNASM
jgi:hypothetical protein